MKPDDHIDSKAARDILAVDKATLSRWVAAGKLVPVMRVGGNGAFVFKRKDVERLKRAA